MSLSGTDQSVSPHLNGSRPAIGALQFATAHAWRELLAAEERVVAAERALFAHLACNDVEFPDLVRCYQQARSRCVHGWYERWRRVGLPSTQELRARGRRVPPDGQSSWEGLIPLEPDTDYPLGPVAFQVFSDSRHRVWVGTSTRFHIRLKRLLAAWNKTAPADWTGSGSWVAYPAKDRDDTYRIAQELRDGIVPA